MQRQRQVWILFFLSAFLATAVWSQEQECNSPLDVDIESFRTQTRTEPETETQQPQTGIESEAQQPQESEPIIEKEADSLSDDECDFDLFVSDEAPMQGFHAVCIDIGNEPNTYHLIGYQHGYFPNRVEADVTAANLADLRAQIEILFDIPLERRDAVNSYATNYMALQPWGLFTHEGFRITKDLPEVLTSHLVLVFEGGQFVWPGVRKGFRRTINHIEGKPGGLLDIETISLQPLVISVDNFLEDGESEHIVAASEVHMAPSPVAHKDGDKGKPATEWRTSTQHWLGASQNPWLKPIDQRVASLVRVPANHQEHLQVLRYHPTQKYDAHHDFFELSHYQSSPDVQRMLHYGTNNRMATVFMYLTTVEEGGSTWFPKAGGLPDPGMPGGAESFISCEKDFGLHSYPKRGKVVIFYSLFASGEPDENSLHAACPPISGDKWSANKWVWNKPTSFYNDY